MAETVPFVSVVVPARNARRTLAGCLSSLLRVDYPVTRREILIVDNGSTDDTARIIRGFPVTYLAEARRGPSRARNRGILASRGDLIAFTDADCVVTSRWLRALVAAFTGQGVEGVAGEILPYPPHTWAEYYMARRQPLWQRAALEAVRPFVVTANVAFRRRVFDRIGLFDPRFVTGQDQDLAWRFLRAGLGLRYAPTAVVFHRHRAGPWSFLRQQLGWAHGAVLLRRLHGLPGGLAAEAAAYRRLLRASGLLLRTVARAPSPAWRGRSSTTACTMCSVSSRGGWPAFTVPSPAAPGGPQTSEIASGTPRPRPGRNPVPAASATPTGDQRPA